jgi:hypothetical protein
MNILYEGWHLLMVLGAAFMWYVVIGLPRGARSLAPASINQRLSADVQNFANTSGPD